jgi:DNA-binding NarL/FixJ family response regulator
MPNGGAANRQCPPMRVLVVEEEGGAVGAVLSSDAGLEVATVLGLLEAEKAVLRVRPHVVVLVLADPSPDLPQRLRAFCKDDQHVAVLIISNPAPERIVTELIKAGAGGYLFSHDTQHLPTAIRELANGGAPMSLPVSRIVLGRARRSSTQMPAVLPSAPVGTSLTRRQLEILELLAGGHSYEDIALALGLSVNTVRWHVKALYERLGASTKVEAVMIGIQLRLLNEGVAPRQP